MSDLTVAVHGATGSQGAPVATALLARGHTVRAISRHPRGAPAGTTHAAADLLDDGALRRAYADADVVVLQLPLVFDESALTMAETAVAAVADAGVARVVVNVGGPVPPEPIGLPYADARLRLLQGLRAGPGTTLAVGPTGPYMENLALPASLASLAGGELTYPLPAQAPIPWVATQDLATVVAAAVTTQEEGHLVVVGPEALTGDAAAAAMADALGHPVRWRTIDADAYEAQLAPVIGPEAAAGIAGFYAAAADGPPPSPAPDSIRTGSTTLAEWAGERRWETAA